MSVNLQIWSCDLDHTHFRDSPKILGEAFSKFDEGWSKIEVAILSADGEMPGDFVFFPLLCIALDRWKVCRVVIKQLYANFVLFRYVVDIKSCEQQVTVC